MQANDFFHQPIEFYHGRVPFIIVSLIKRLREIHAETDSTIFKQQKVGNNINNLIHELSLGEVQKLKNYDNVATLSIALVRYLDSITKENPLFTSQCKENLVKSNLSLKSSDCESIFRKSIENLYPGGYRTIYTITDFLKNIESASLDSMFDLFGNSFFGSDSMKSNRRQFRTLFILLLIHHQEIFNGAILGQAAYLNPQQIKMLQRRVNRSIQNQPEAIIEREIDVTNQNEINKNSLNIEEEDEEQSKTNTQEQSKISNEEEEIAYSSNNGKKPKSKPKKNLKKKKGKTNKKQNLTKDESPIQIESQNEQPNQIESQNELPNQNESQNELPNQNESENESPVQNESENVNESPVQSESPIHSESENESPMKDESHNNQSENDHKYTEVALQAVCLSMTPVKKIIHYEGQTLETREIEVKEKVVTEIESESSLQTGIDFFDAAVDAINNIANDKLTFSQESIDLDD